MSRYVKTVNLIWSFSTTAPGFEGAVTVNKSCPPQLVVAHPAVLKDAVRHGFNPVRASSIDRVFIEQLQSTPLIFENCFRLLKTQSSPATRLFERRAMKQRASARHLRFVEPSPSTRAVPHSSSPTVLLFSKKLSNIASTQISGVLLSSCDRHRQPKLIAYSDSYTLHIFLKWLIAVTVTIHDCCPKTASSALLVSKQAP